MTLKTSFFNKGIYKSTLKRYAWGSLLYFIILFVSTVLSLFLNIRRDFDYMPVDYFTDYPVILHGQYIVIPILLAIVVPTVVALLVFRFIHSKKQAIFIHSIPVSRKANYISSLLAAFTLMYVPIILNGIILIVMSLCGFGDFFTVSNCLTWIGYNLLGIFMMFSCSVLSASITGNSFALIVINIIIHSFLFITASTFGVMADVFIYGFTEGNVVYESIIENNFAVVVYGFTDKYFRGNLSILKIAEYALASVILYISSYFLYNKRKIETASEVAGFKCLNCIFKYLVTFIITMFSFAVFSSYIDENVIAFTVILALISIIAYFASEMILKKTVNVIYSWKGYIGFVAVFLLIVTIFSQTSFFGYETRIPDKNDIFEATIYNYYYLDDEPFVTDENTIDMIIAAHKGFVEADSIPKISGSNNIYKAADTTRIHIKYNLKNGDKIYRMYSLSDDECVKIMNKFYKDNEYKKKCEFVFLDVSQINKVYVDHDIEIKETEKIIALLREDVLNLSFEDLHRRNNSTYNMLYSIRIDYKITDEEIDNGAPTVRVTGRYIEITDKYEKTIKWLKEKGYKALN